jgi:glycosyltransferase involved in cell wall biosynthesis
MNANEQLSIVIPTYNRADFIDSSLEIHIPIVENFNIQIHIFDNASADNTLEIVSKWMQTYPFLSYHHNNTNIGPDANFERALQFPNTEYIWLLGDSTCIEKKVFEKIFSETKNKYDLILINAGSRVTGIESKIINNENILLSELGWHMTQMSTLIYSKNLIAEAAFWRYQNTNFIQAGIIFEYLAKKNSVQICWLQDYSVIGISKKGLVKKSWEAQTFEIWAYRWTNFIFSLPPQYLLKNKLKAIIMHDKKMKVFSTSNLLFLRNINAYNLGIYHTYKYLFPFTADKYSSIVFKIIAIFPIKILRLIVSIKTQRKILKSFIRRSIIYNIFKKTN